MFWRERVLLRAFVPSTSVAGLLVIAVGLLVWLAGSLGAMAVVQFAGVVVALAGVVITSFGAAVSRRFAFPILFLVFMIPMGNGLVPTLIDWTADATVFALRATGYPVYREGRFFTLPTGNWEVEAGCSGLRYLIAAMVLALVFAYVNMRSWKRRLLFVGFAILMSLVANWARAYMIVLIGHYSEMRYGTGADHLYFGWVFFGLVMFLVFWAGNRWADDQMQTSVAAPVGPARPIPLSTDAAVRLAALGALALAVTAVISESGRAADAVPRTDAAQVAERTLRERYFGPVSVGARFDGARYIEQGRLARLEDIEYLVGYFASQVPGAELVTVTNEPVDDVSGRWRVEGPLRVDGGEGVAANETAVRADGVSWLVWHWYTVAGVHYASESRVKLATLAALISTGSDDATVSLVAIRVDQRGVEQARQRLRMAVGEVRRFGEAVTVR
jgi:exosortase A